MVKRRGMKKKNKEWTIEYTCFLTILVLALIGGIGAIFGEEDAILALLPISVISGAYVIGKAVQ